MTMFPQRVPAGRSELCEDRVVVSLVYTAPAAQRPPAQQDLSPDSVSE